MGLIGIRGHLTKGVTLPKGGRERQVNMTERLKGALVANRHLRGDRVLWRNDGHEKVTGVLLAKWMRRAERPFVDLCLEPRADEPLRAQTLAEVLRD